MYIDIEVKPHKSLERRGNDIYTNLEIDAVSAALGTTVEVPTVHGDKLLKIPAGTQPGTVLKMSNLGGPKFKGTGNGDQYVKIYIKIPKHMSKKEKTIWNPA